MCLTCFLILRLSSYVELLAWLWCLLGDSASRAGRARGGPTRPPEVRYRRHRCDRSYA